MTKMMITLFSLLFALTISQVFVKGFEITFPVGPNESSYWISCKENTLQWTYNSTDPTIFSVALLNINTTKLNGNYQIANSVPSVNGTVKVRPNCVEPGSGYYVAFVNASQYALNQPQIYYTSPAFTIQPNSTQTPPVPTSQSIGQSSSGNSGIENTQSNTSSSPQFGPANAGQTTNNTEVVSSAAKSNGVMTSYTLQSFAYIASLIVCSALMVSL